jgi:hypothetical protein
MVVEDKGRRGRGAEVQPEGSARMEKRLERIIVTLRLTVVQHHARAHLAPPPIVAKPILPVVS